MATTTLSDFPQVYVVGATDGTDSVTLDLRRHVRQHAQFQLCQWHGQRGELSVGGLVRRQCHGPGGGASDSAVFYSYPKNTFTGATATSSLGGSTTNVAGSSVNFVSQASGYSSVSVFESASARMWPT